MSVLVSGPRVFGKLSMVRGMTPGEPIEIVENSLSRPGRQRATGAGKTRRERLVAERCCGTTRSRRDVVGSVFWGKWFQRLVDLSSVDIQLKPK